MLPNYLANIKSSGIYRFVWDKSEIPGQDAETLRLVVGYSEKGPFNTPVYVTTEGEFRQIFGGPSKKLERYGMWFHRLAIQALKKGPILALNIKNFTTSVDSKNKVDYVTFNPNAPIFHTESGTIIDNLTMKVNDLYNTDRFWTLEPEHIEDYVNDNNSVSTPKGYITIVSTDSADTSTTIFMRGYEPKGYDISFAEWYSTVLNGEELPSYMEGHERDLVSQYWAEVFIFRGQFTPEVASSDNLAKFFDVNGTDVKLKSYITNAFGEKIDTLTALAANDASNFIRSYAGILLPDFRSASNTVISLDSLVNGDNYLHKVMMRLNQDMLFSIDPESTDPTAFSLTDIDTTGWNLGPATTTAMMSISALDPIVFEAIYTDGEWSYNEGTHQGMAADYYKYNAMVPDGGVQGYTMTFMNAGEEFGKTGISEGDTLYLQQAGIQGFVGTTHVTKITQIPGYSNYTVVQGGNAYEGQGIGKLVENGGVYSIEIESISPTNADIQGTITLTAVQGVENTYEFTGTSTAEYTLKITGDAPVFEMQIDQPLDDNNTSITIYKCVSSVSYTSTNLAPLYLKGYTYGNPKPASTGQWDKLQWQSYMLDALTIYKGVREALTNRKDVNYRYLVDTFEGFVENECKAKLSAICKEKDNAFAILNFPAMSSFSKCKYTSFRNDANEFSTKYIAQGGNPLKPMAVYFTLPSQENGASFCGFFTATKIRNAQTSVIEIVPSAALVSNNFMDKYTKYLPYTIIAGTNRGILRENGLMGPDFNYSRADLDVLEPMGVNCLVYVDRKGTVINSEQTAKQNPVTTLSYIHVRELCIFLQDEIERLLEDYHWDFNTPNLQQRIQDRADVILETCKNNEGVYTYQNLCADPSVNTDEVVNNGILILQTSIEPTMGAGKMVQELTLYAKGGMSSRIISE